MRKTHAADWLIFCAGWAICFVIRLLPWRPPNIEPVTATLLPFGKNYGYAGGLLFGFLSMFLFDVVTSGIGTWTFITGITYGVIGMASHAWFRNRRGTMLQYAVFAAVATLFYDAVTGVILGPVLFDMPLKDAFLGQIPFTINHLIGNIVLGATLSPIIDRWLIRNPKLHPPVVLINK